MLSPDTRTIAIDLLRPPAGCRLDKAVLTTYSLDLEALLALPLAVLAHADGGMEELLADPLLLLEALRQAGASQACLVGAVSRRTAPEQAAVRVSTSGELV